MLPKIYAFALLVICALISHSEAAECEPQSVTNLRVNTNHYLLWSLRDNEECQITEFLVYIFHRNHPVEYSFAVKEPYVDVRFLEVCQEWTFVVVPVSEHTPGREQRLVTTLPLPTNANLTITSINITRKGPLNERHLEWDLEDAHLGNCTLQFRVTVEIEGNPYIEDIYVSEKSINLRFLSPCATYLFGVRAINIGYPTIEGPLRLQSHNIASGRQGSPRLVSVSPDYDGFNTTWLIESAVRNACPVRWFYIDGGVRFRKTVVLNESDGRGPINVTVDGLGPNNMYYFTASLVNSAGYSHPAAAAVQTLSLTQKQEEKAPV